VRVSASVRLRQCLWSVGLGSAGAFSILAVKVSRSDPNRIDRAVARLLTAPRASTSFHVFTDLSLGGTSVFVAVGAVALACLTWWRSRDARLTALCLVAPAVAGLLEVAAKEVIGRRRPVSADLWGAKRFGFPSGHATGAAALATLVVVLVVVLHVPRSWRRMISVAAVAFALTVSLSRIVVDDHLTMDSVGGLLLGTSTTAVGAAIALRPTSRARHRFTDSSVSL
jgi:undecaprenyl-diphosphatase